MFARFKTPGKAEEKNINVTLVRNFEPGTVEGTTRIEFLSGDAVVVPFSTQAVRGAFKRAVSSAPEATES